jgi:hypothetical protein
MIDKVHEILFHRIAKNGQHEVMGEEEGPKDLTDLLLDPIDVISNDDAKTTPFPLILG